MRVRILLNSAFSGPHAWWFLARERGYFSDAGLEVEFIAGDGAAAVVPLIGQDGIEAGYGDLNALGEVAAHQAPHTAPVAVFSVFNTAPFTIAVRADGPIHQASDLAGHFLTGHAHDAALKLFPAVCELAGIAPEPDMVTPSVLPLGEQVRDLLLPGRVDGVFGFVNTIIAAVTPLGVDPAQLRFINFADTVPDLYANSLIVSRQLTTQSPDAVRALVAGVNRGLAETLADIDAGIAAVARAAPSIDVAVQRRRLAGTLAAEMAHPEGARIGIGDLDDARLARGLALLARTCGWPRVPAVDEIFTRVFLPPLTARVRTLAR